jgi:hypothetical protein
MPSRFCSGCSTPQEQSKGEGDDGMANDGVDPARAAARHKIRKGKRTEQILLLLNKCSKNFP